MFARLSLIHLALVGFTFATQSQEPVVRLDNAVGY
jgi:hypothetical protein